MSTVMMFGSLFLFKDYFSIDIVKAWTVALTTLAVFQWFNAWNCRHESKSIFQMNPLSNIFLIVATITIILLHMLIIYNPTMQKLMKTTSLSLSEWIIILLVGTPIIIAEEIRKLFYRKNLFRKNNISLETK